MKIRLGLLLLIFAALPSHAATINASCTQASIASAVASASNGDTVLVTSGTSFTGNATITTSKAITINGGGICTVTVTVHGWFNVQATTTAEFRITGFTFTNNTDVILIYGGCNNYSYCGNVVSHVGEFDHNTLSNNSGQTFLWVYDDAPFVIHNNTFTVGSGGGAAEMIHDYSVGADLGATTGWNTPVVPASPAQVYIETNTFTFNISSGLFFGTSAIQSYNGARTVVRYNTMNNVQIDQHGTCGEPNVRWWEIYNNQFNVTSGVNQSNYMAIRGGTGVIFNNHQSGSNLGAGSLELTEDCNSGSYPLAQQIGRGLNSVFSPAYVWGNDSGLHVGSGNATYVQQGRDYFLSGTQPATMYICETAAQGGNSSTCPTTYNYVPYTYPYPFGGSPPLPPTSLTSTVVP